MSFDPVNERVPGIVKSFNRTTGNGIIVRTDTGDEIFVDRARIVDHNSTFIARYLLVNEQVEFSISYVNNNNRPEALYVTGPGGSRVDSYTKGLEYATLRNQQAHVKHSDAQQFITPPELISNEELDYYKKKFGDKEVHVAVRQNYPELLKIFAKKRNFVQMLHESNNDSLTPLHLAVKNDFVDCVKILMPYDRNASQMKSRDGDTPLHVAINFHREEIADLLLSYPTVDPALENDDGQNALTLAAAKGELRIIQKIMNFKPELVNVFNRNGFSPLHLAIFNAYEEIANYFIREIICNKNARVMKHRTYKSFTPLHLAVVKMQPSVIENLVECGGVDLNLTEDEREWTPLHLAVDNLSFCGGCDVTASHLFALQQIDAYQLNMENLLQLSSKCLPLAMCCYLLAKGADPNVKNKTGMTPMEMLPKTMQKFLVVFRTLARLHMSSSAGPPLSILSKFPNCVEGDTNCYLCNDAPSVVRFEPCNHVLYCANCIEITADRIRHCVRCRREIAAKIGPKGEIRQAKRQPTTASTSEDDARLSCTVCFERQPTWMVPKCGHPICQKCCRLVAKCQKCGHPMVDLRQVYLG